MNAMNALNAQHSQQKPPPSRSGEILPEEICHSVLLFLSAKDAASLTAANRFLKKVGNTKIVWEKIYKRDASQEYSVFTSTTTDQDLFEDVASAKQAVVMNALKNSLKGGVRWYPLNPEMRISAREGHLACTVTCGEERRSILTGGFTDDEDIYLINPGKAFSSSNRRWSMNSVTPASDAGFVYGASLTPLPGIPSEDGGSGSTFRALRFGGFRAGGYSHETNEVALLTITARPGEDPTANWTIIEAKNAGVILPRAYHTATLLWDQYLYVVGGMRSSGSIMEPCLLDINEWRWCRSMVSPSLSIPSARHGHSVVLDKIRNRLVMFGGGTGSDLLRSGRDNSEVWEINMGDSWHDELSSCPSWSMNKICCGHAVDNEDFDGQGNNSDEDSPMSENRLSPSEALCLGRCHMSCKISQDIVLLFFGSGRPSTNGLIAFDLNKNDFFRPSISGVLPVPRFTGAFAACLEDGYILTHGGYSSQVSDSISRFDVIDLVPSLRTGFNKLTVDTTRRSSNGPTDAQAEAAREVRHHGMIEQMFWASLLAAQNRAGVNSSDEEEDNDEDDEEYEMEDSEN